MKNENNIDNYFDKVKQNPPLIPIEKVHQIITRPGAKARLKGNNRNLLKITVMTTIIAVILSAVLLWPEQTTSNKSQNSIPIATNIKAIGTKVQMLVNGSNTSKPVNQTPNQNEARNAPNTKNDADFQQSQQQSDRAFAEKEESETLLPQLGADGKKVNSTLEGIMPVGADNEKVDLDTIQTIDGNRFILKLSNDELEKLGFHISDSLFIYNNKFGNEYLQFFYKVHWGIRDGEPFIEGTSSSYLYQNEKPFYQKISSNEFYPVFQSNIFFTGIKAIKGLDIENFHSSNDTLLPVLIPSSQFYKEFDDQLLWFKTTDELYSILYINHKSIIDQFKKYKTSKIANKDNDLIVYQPPKLVDESKIIDLTNAELKTLGFQFFTDSTIFNGEMKTEKVTLVLFKGCYSSTNTYADSIGTLWNNGCFPVLVTHLDGNPLIKVRDFKSRFLLKTMKYEQQLQLLIPVNLNASESQLEKEVIFWFYPTEEFFNALPKRIRNDLRKEYNYVIAEDKSTLEKPECVYFEECKNTLSISNFKVYPNPANSNTIVSFTLPEAINGRITLIDLLGRERQVLQPNTNYAKGSHQFEVDLSNVPEGIYLIALCSDKGIQTQRLIVAR
jgi:hypothetical protein